MLAILISLLIAAVIIYIVYLIVNLIPFPAPIKTIVWIIFGLIIIFYLLNLFGIYSIK